MNNLQMTAVLRLVAPPEPRFSKSGHAFVTFRGASNERVRDSETGSWRDGDATFLSVTVLDKNIAENIIESDLQAGDDLVVHGQFQQRDYEVDGVKKSSFVLLAQDVGFSLRRRKISVERTIPTPAAPPSLDSGGATPW